MTTPPDFSVGQVLTAAQMNAVGLWLIKTDTITSVASKEITGIFSADFRNYLIVLDNVKLSAAGIVQMQMGTTATGYYFGGTTVNYATGAVTGEKGANSSTWFASAVADTKSAAVSITVFSPNEATQTSYECRGTDARTNGAGLRAYSGFLDNTTAYTSVTFTNTGSGPATFTSCNVSVYGMRN